MQLAFIVNAEPAIGKEGAELHIEVETISFSRPFWAALSIPVAAGETIVFDKSFIEGLSWTLPDGFKLGDILYPLAQTYNVEAASATYSQALTILFEIIPTALYEQNNTELSLPYSFNLDIAWQICALDCYSKTQNFAFEMIEGNGEIDTAKMEVFYNARQLSLPPLPWPASIAIYSEQYMLEVVLPDRLLTLGKPIFFPIEEDFNGAIANEQEYSQGILNLVGRKNNGTTTLEQPYFRTLSGILAFENNGILANGYRLYANNMNDELIVWQKNEESSKPDLSFVMALFLAFVGGLILNLMPCVFPVLAMKAFHLASLANKSQIEIRRDGIAYTLGILASFLIVASVLILLRNMGGVVGWGFQLQSPVFVLVLIIVIGSVTLNFLGGFEFKLAPLQNLGQSGTLTRVFGGGERAASFSTGVLATVVATPCTAPFMAPAIGYALLQPPLNSLLIFMSLGLGLAFPYLILSFIPAFGRLLPKPGAWMVRLRKWLALPLGLTILWLFWVLAQQVTTSGLKFALASSFLFATGLMFWLNDRFVKFKKVALLSFLLSLVFISLMAGHKQQDTETNLPGIVAGLETLEWSPQLVDAYRAEGRPIFLNVTAAWCITCLVHEKLVFENDSFQAYMNDNNIVYMVADWTNPDSRIAGLLAQYDRSGIPFYIFYPEGGEGSAVLFPEILTPSSTIMLLENNR